MNNIPEIEISLRFKYPVNTEKLYKINTSRDCYEVLKQCFNSDTILWREEFILLCLNRANKVVGFYKVSAGGLSATIADPKIIFTVLLNAGASGFILSHNHPSGNLTPSSADKDLTRKLIEGGKLLDFTCLDHIIVTDENYLSFADEGLL